MVYNYSGDFVIRSHSGADLPSGCDKNASMLTAAAN
jgi:hypothetical protein